MSHDPHVLILQQHLVVSQAENSGSLNSKTHPVAQRGCERERATDDRWRRLILFVFFGGWSHLGEDKASAGFAQWDTTLENRGLTIVNI